MRDCTFVPLMDVFNSINFLHISILQQTQLEGEMRKVAEAEDAKTKLRANLAKTEELLENTKVKI